MADMGVVVRAAGGPEAMEWTELDTAVPGPGEARIAQHAIGVNFIDTYFRSGLYPWPSTPLIPGRYTSSRIRSKRRAAQCASACPASSTSHT